MAQGIKRTTWYLFRTSHEVVARLALSFLIASLAKTSGKFGSPKASLDIHENITNYFSLQPYVEVTARLYKDGTI